MNDIGPIISAQSLVKRYGTMTAVNSVDFHVNPGECFGLLGPNGAGKSSIIRMLTGVSPVTAGLLTVLGLDASAQSREVKWRIGVVPQEDNLDPDFRVRKNLEVHARYFGIPRAVARERALQALDVVQLRDRQESRVDTLSGGMKRRLMIARALMNDPPLLVLDEPTTGLDPQSRHLLWDKLHALKRQGVTILLTTHYMEEAAQLCDRMVIMDHGHILVEGRPNELVKKHAGDEVVEIRPRPGHHEPVRDHISSLGVESQDGGDTVYVYAAAGQLANDLAGTEADVTRRTANLEDVFLRLTGRELRDE